MRAAAALLGAAAILQGCAQGGGDRSAILLAGLDELGNEIKDARIPLCAKLSERRPLEKRAWAFIESPPPPGFEDLAKSTAVDGPLSLEPLRTKLPRQWFLQEDGDELCFQLTRPVIRDRRALITGAFTVDLTGTWNFWLRREAERWRVVATTKGHYDI
jgi:hypothetical protein